MASQGGGDGSTGSQVDAQHPEPLGLHRRAHCLLVASRSGSPPGMGGPHWSFLGFQNTFRWATAIRIVWRVGGAGNRKYDNINV